MIVNITNYLCQKYNGGMKVSMLKLKEKIASKCTKPEYPCAITFEIREELESFNEVVRVFSSKGFDVKEFIDDFMCVLSRENEGINEAVKIKDNKIQVQALKKTLLELSDDLAIHCSNVEE